MDKKIFLVSILAALMLLSTPVISSVQVKDISPTKNYDDIYDVHTPLIHIFVPCNNILIESDGGYFLNQLLGYWSLEKAGGHVTLEDYSWDFPENQYEVYGFINGFSGDIISDGWPLKIEGTAAHVTMQIISTVIDLDTDKEGNYKKGETVTFTLKNIYDTQIELEDVTITVSTSGVEPIPHKELYSEAYTDSIILEKGETFTWSWDQKDNNGNQVAYSNTGYIALIGGTINGYEHYACAVFYTTPFFNKAFSNPIFKNILERLLFCPIFNNLLNLR